MALVLFFWWTNVKIRRTHENNAVIGNLRQLAAAADQYYLENNVTTVGYSSLVGPTNYIRAINIVAGEKFPAHYTQGHTMTASGIAGARTITYSP